MTIVGKYFPGQAPSERVFLVLRRSVITYFAFLAVALIMVVPLVILFVLALRSPDIFSAEPLNAGLTLAVSAYLLFILGLMLYGFVDYYLDVYIITDERIVDIKQTGFFKREIAELHLREVQDVSAQVRGILPTMFHFGDVAIQTAGERENFIFTAVPHPYQVAKKIADLHEAQVERQRLMAEAGIRDQIASGFERNPSIDQEKEPEASALSVSNEPRVKDQVLSNDQLFEHYSKEAPSTEENAPAAEHFTERGLSEEKLVQGAPTDVNAGLADIDEYVNETAKENEQVAKQVELEEGKVEEIK